MHQHEAACRPSPPANQYIKPGTWGHKKASKLAVPTAGASSASRWTIDRTRSDIGHLDLCSPPPQTMGLSLFSHSHPLSEFHICHQSSARLLISRAAHLFFFLWDLVILQHIASTPFSVATPKTVSSSALPESSLAEQLPMPSRYQCQFEVACLAILDR